MLYDNQQRMVDFSSECKFISSYVDLMKLRMASNVKVDVEITIPEHDRSQVAPLLFISLVENAFKHGVSSTEPSSISIKLIATETEIRCNIVNTNFPKTSNDRSGHGIGLQQVQQRLNSLYQGCYTWNHGVSESDGLYHSEIVLKSPSPVTM
jgi:LytS/YehU family sensor histidine kinase